MSAIGEALSPGQALAAASTEARRRRSEAIGVIVAAARRDLGIPADVPETGALEHVAALIGSGDVVLRDGTRDA
jgi:hypothetical protein